MTSLDSPFLPIDYALAERILAWHGTDDELLRSTIIATSYALHQGHTCLSLALCQNQAPYNRLSHYGLHAFPPVEAWCQHLKTFKLSAQDDSPIVLNDQRVYLRRYWQFETDLAQFIQQHRQPLAPLTTQQRTLARARLDEFFPDASADLDWQKVAAANTLLSRFSVIIGGPGTGKTYTVTRILALLTSLSEHPLTIQLAAPTGKAAQRLAESIRESKKGLTLDLFDREAIPNDAQTLHRLLGVIPNRLDFRHHQNNPIDADVLLVDEVSMIDLPLMTRLTRAIRPTTRVILLGDADQLPSVAAGSVLADMIQRPLLGYSKSRRQQLKTLGINVPIADGSDTNDHVTELVHSRRFSNDSDIGRLAQAVIAGETVTSVQILKQSTHVTWSPSSERSTRLKQWTAQYYQHLSQQNSLKDAFALLQKFRILCVTRAGDWGVESINQSLVKALNPSRRPFYSGQPIMVTENHYGLKLFNGDIGLIWPNDNGQLMAWFDAEHAPRAVTPARLPAHETVYAMTIHKTQGSEFDHVALMLPDQPSPLLTRELIYTGLTRAKQNFDCIGDEAIWISGVATKVERWAGLANRLSDKDR